MSAAGEHGPVEVPEQRWWRPSPSRSPACRSPTSRTEEPHLRPKPERIGPTKYQSRGAARCVRQPAPASRGRYTRNQRYGTSTPMAVGSATHAEAGNSVPAGAQSPRDFRPTRPPLQIRDGRPSCDYRPPRRARRRQRHVCRQHTGTARSAGRHASHAEPQVMPSSRRETSGGSVD